VSAELAYLNPLMPPYTDPPLGGYTYQFTNPGWSIFQPNFATAAPFYYSPQDISSGCAEVNSTTLACGLPMSDTYTLNFFDAPHNTSYSATVPCLAFTTQLVGICGTGSEPSSICSSPGSPSAPLYQWTWKSNFNGKNTGGVYGVETASFYVNDPSSGTGGIAVTSINGAQLPPAVPASQVATTASGLAYSRVSQTFNGTVTLRNISGGTISGPLQIIFTGMPANVTLVNATANLSGTPYLTVPVVASLAPGQSVTVGVQFKNPSNATLNLVPVIYSGSIN
jgi:hypothetical protein